MSDLGTAVNNAVRDAVQQENPSQMVTASLVCYEFIDGEGRRKLAVWPSEDARWWDVKGFVGYAEAVADEHIAMEVRGSNR